MKCSVSHNDIHRLISAGRRLLSKTGKATVHFIIIRDGIMLRRIEELRDFDMKAAEKAVLAILVLSDCEANEHWIEEASAASAGICTAADCFGLQHYCINVRNKTDETGFDLEDVLQHMFLFPMYMKPVSLIVLTEMADGYTAVITKLRKMHYDRW